MSAEIYDMRLKIDASRYSYFTRFHEYSTIIWASV